jgi:dienelactone hydrolase
MVGHFTYDETASGPRPGVLVFPEAFGLGEHAMGRAERLTKEFGYAALACDLHGERQEISELEKVMPLLAPLRGDPARVRDRTGKALQALTSKSQVDAGRVAAIGFCFGGTMSFELALAGADLRAAVGFHSGLAVTSPKDAKNIKGKVLVLLGADDPGIPPQARTEFEATMREGGVDWEMVLYGKVVHSFTNPAADSLGRPEFLRYDPRADRLSWKAMGDLFAEVLA